MWRGEHQKPMGGEAPLIYGDSTTFIPPAITEALRHLVTTPGRPRCVTVQQTMGVATGRTIFSWVVAGPAICPPPSTGCPVCPSTRRPGRTGMWLGHDQLGLLVGETDPLSPRTRPQLTTDTGTWRSDGSRRHVLQADGSGFRWSDCPVGRLPATPLSWTILENFWRISIGKSIPNHQPMVMSPSGGRMTAYHRRQCYWSRTRWSF